LTNQRLIGQGVVDSVEAARGAAGGKVDRAIDGRACAVDPRGGVMPSAVSKSAAMAPQSVSSVGGSQPHTNFQPYLCVDFIISLFGIFPSPP
jgi:microcystin-dependent protein